MTCRLRAARLADIPAVLALWHTAGAVPSVTDDHAAVERLIGHDPPALIVAEDPEGVVGSVIAGWDGWRGTIYRLAVAPSHRRSGLGRRLLSHAEARLAEVGARRLQATVDEGDGRAVSFWRSSGWTEQAERGRFVKN